MVALAIDRCIRDEATTEESVWVGWLAALKPETFDLDTHLDPAQRLVVVSPHPDDEVLGCGGLMALHAGRGGEVAVIAVTDGEASHRGDPHWPPTRLAGERRAERERGLARLGVTAAQVILLALPDSEVRAQRARLEYGLRHKLRPTDCVVSTWQLDGHPDHDATGEAAARACRDIGCRFIQAPVWMWQWSAPGDARVPWDRLRELPLSASTLALKAAALDAHQTQLVPRTHDLPILGRAMLARAARRAEYFFV